MDQPECGLTVFADVDLGPEEVGGDFAHEPLPARPELGTVGLWCALHGESILRAGLHHLAARLDFEEVGKGLAQWRIRTMPPFSNFPHLKQEFTQGEIWMVSADELKILERDHLISPEHLEGFRKEGTIGSHLEIIQRGEGFKGFNQEAVSDIIRRTDPRGEWRDHSAAGAA